MNPDFVEAMNNSKSCSDHCNNTLLDTLAHKACIAVANERRQYEYIINFYEQYVEHLLADKDAAEKAARKLLSENEQLRKELDHYRYPSEEEVMDYEREYSSNKLNLGGSNLMRRI